MTIGKNGVKVIRGYLETKKEQSEETSYVFKFKWSTDELSYDGRYNDNLRRQVNGYLSDASVFLEDILGGCNDLNCNIALDLGVIMAHFYTFIFLRT